MFFSNPFEASLVNSCDFNFDENSKIACIHYLLKSAQESEASNWKLKYEELPPHEIKLLPSSEQAPKLELKPLPFAIKYAFLGTDETFPVVISYKLDSLQEGKLLNFLRKYKSAIVWNIADIKGISTLVCTHKIYLEYNAKLSREMQRRLNPTMKKAVRIEVLKLLDVGIIYPIADSKWVSPTQVVPKKSRCKIAT